MEESDMKLTKLVSSFLLASCFLMGSTTTHSDGDVGLIDLMGNFQYFAHKVGLSIRAGNGELADFYMHEIEENLEAVEKIEEYDGHPVGALAIQYLTPEVENVESNIDDGDMDGALEAYGRLVTACNSCHLVTDHGFIKVVDRSTENPYMQVFE